jgi:hypothetical protein
MQNVEISANFYGRFEWERRLWTVNSQLLESLLQIAKQPRVKQNVSRLQQPSKRDWIDCQTAVMNIPARKIVGPIEDKPIKELLDKERPTN